MYLFLFSLLLIFDHLLQLVVGSCVLCLQFLALDSQVTTKLLHLDKEAELSSRESDKSKQKNDIEKQVEENGSKCMQAHKMLQNTNVLYLIYSLLNLA